MENLHSLTAHKLKELISGESISPSDILNDVFHRIELLDLKIKAIVLKNRQKARDSLKASSAKKQGKLFGIPVLIKDNICVKDEATTCASKILEGFKPPYDATVVRRMEGEGAILIGKANMDEFAFGSSCETSCYGPTRNPHDLERIPGGSSGGSAAAVASDETVLALGSDTGGSIRQPAALCGVVGLKPTYGRVSRYGLIAFASSLDQIGPITKDVEDAAIMLNVIAGHDEMDSTSVELPVPDYTKSLVKDVLGLRIGVPKEYFVKGLDEEVAMSVKNAIDVFKGLGAKVTEMSLPHTEYAVSVYYIVAPAEASSNLARFDGVQYGFRARDARDIVDMYIKTRSEGFGSEAKRRILLGTYCLSTGYYDAYYLKAQKVRTKIREDFDRAFESYDCIVTPTTPAPAFKIGEKTGDPLSMYLSDVYTIPANLAGLPAISIPCGFSKTGLPIGLQILAKPFDEETIFRAAYTFEQNTDHHKKKPNL
ncbi:MAG: Asp-tRNA(Asn)/Glu-tRNA(Gln) amidotransferase subunit GatA [Candidatus Omnitrophota bacterium]|nr:Asp-tRNA(Asn)/Glu-tRNA(Gln) amidotransferase subunit GatA [Candidatus Omnitrophota bacterium]